MIGIPLARWRLHALFLLSGFCLGALQEKAVAGDLPVEIKLIWATNEANSPDPKHKKLDTDLTKWLQEHHKWKNYFQVNLKNATLHGNSVSKVEMSPECRLELMHLANSRLEVKLYGKNKLVTKVVGEIPSGKWLVIAGDSQGNTAWFIAVRQASK